MEIISDPENFYESLGSGSETLFLTAHRISKSENIYTKFGFDFLLLFQPAIYSRRCSMISNLVLGQSIGIIGIILVIKFCYETICCKIMNFHIMAM